MSGLPFGRRWRRLPGGVLGMLALVALVESSLSGHRLDLVGPAAEDWRSAARAAETRTAGRDVLCFGDSLVKYGVLPRVIEARSGLKSYNLATAGGTMPSAYFLLRRAFDSGARPRAIIADFAALMLPDPDPPAPANYAELATLGDCLDLAWGAHDAGFFGSLALAKLVPSYRWRFEIRGAVRASLLGRFVPSRPGTEILRQLWAEALGAQPMPEMPPRPPTPRVLVDGCSPPAWSIEPRNRRYLDRFLGLADRRGVTVFWLIPPLGPEVHARRAEVGADDAYARFARDRAAEHRSVVVVDARRSGYDDSVHIDHMHLDRRGARVLSADLAALLVDRLGAGPGRPNWLDLPALAGRTGPGGDGPSRTLATTPGASLR